MDNKPLVSVIVVCYNASEYIIETLESVKAQTYKNIEVIITDDCSKDETVSRCKDWLKSNQGKFVNIKIIESEKNTGVTVNLNRGLKASTGEWIKPIAGDDKLTPNCIDDNIAYVQLNPQTNVLFSDMQMFGKVDEMKKHININCRYFGLNKEEFRNRLFFMNFLPAPTLFINTNVFSRYGYYDETIPMMEDWPYWLRLLRNNVEMSYMNKVTIQYRVHESISISKKPNPKFLESQKKARELSTIYSKDVSILLSYYIRTFYYKCPNNFIKALKWILLIINPYHYYFKAIERKVKD